MGGSGASLTPPSHLRASCRTAYIVSHTYYLLHCLNTVPHTALIRYSTDRILSLSLIVYHTDRKEGKPSPIFRNIHPPKLVDSLCAYEVR